MENENSSSNSLLRIKGEINVITLLLTVCTVLGSFSTWTLNNAYQAAKHEFDEIKEYRRIMSSRMDKLEQQNIDQFASIRESLGDLNSRFDKITEIKVKK